MRQIVINIDDRVYGLLKYFEKALGLNDKKDGNDDVKTALMRAVINGTPLPKGHGDLIDKDRLLDELEKTVKSVDDTNKHLLFWDRAVAHVHLSKPIIEADKESEE